MEKSDEKRAKNSPCFTRSCKFQHFFEQGAAFKFRRIIEKEPGFKFRRERRNFPFPNRNFFFQPKLEERGKNSPQSDHLRQKIIG